MSTPTTVTRYIYLPDQYCLRFSYPSAGKQIGQTQGLTFQPGLTAKTKGQNIQTEKKRRKLVVGGTVCLFHF